MIISAIKRMLLFGVLLSLFGCAYKYTTTFIVRNISSQVVTVRVSEPGSDSEITEFSIEPGRQHNIFSGSDRCPENYIPMDTYTDDTMLPPTDDTAVLEIWVAGRKLSDDIRRREYWYYYSTDYMEKYTISISDEAISYFLESE